MILRFPTDNCFIAGENVRVTEAILWPAIVQRRMEHCFFLFFCYKNQGIRLVRSIIIVQMDL
jgi:hypothetical protein